MISSKGDQRAAGNVISKNFLQLAKPLLNHYLPTTNIN